MLEENSVTAARAVPSFKPALQPCYLGRVQVAMADPSPSFTPVTRRQWLITDQEEENVFDHLEAPAILYPSASFHPVGRCPNLDSQTAGC